MITCFNYGRYLEAAVESALQQEGGAPEIVVVDDGSTDPDTVTALDRLPPGVRVLRRDRSGVCVARNAGLAEARTPYVLVLDADDRLAEGVLAVLRRPLDASPEVGFAYGHARFFGDWQGVLRFPPYDEYRLLYRHIIGLSALMRSQVVTDTGGYDPEFAHFEDWELWVNALAHGWKGIQVDAVTLEYRQHAGSKVREDRRSYRHAFRRLRSKHAALYADRARFARASSLGLLGRGAYRFFWGPRPLPARLERGLQDLLWRPRKARVEP
ncbi:MAG: glycosyltransferase family 2 protein [Actinomycetota bacterium]|nr:glycosyltransferase family 2 protein [Actinomycetota bacterium]